MPERRTPFALLPSTFLICSMMSPSWAAGDLPGAVDHPALPRYEGSIIVAREVATFDEVELPSAPVANHSGPAGNPNSFLSAEGRVTRLAYQAPAGRTAAEIARNYENAFENAGFVDLFDCAGAGCGIFFLSEARWSAASQALPSAEARYRLGRRADGTLAAVLVLDGGPSVAAVIELTVVEPKAPEQRMVVVAAPEMAREIATTGKVALRAVLFDFDKAVLRPDSRPQLEEIARYLEENPSQAVLVVGHTDATGTFDYNLDLSQRRAEAVVAALVREHGIARDRLTPFGAGMTSPVATNRTEEGMALNRRVEIVDHPGAS